MVIKKIHTTNSTNTYLRKWSKEEYLQNFTVLVSEEQTAGRGQRENIWQSKKGKNLTFSILIRLDDFEVSRQFELNQAVSLGLVMAIKKYLSTSDFSLKIKWPNDIFVTKKKIAGILIENTLSASKIKQSVVGIGLNVNQVNFPNSLPNASSMQVFTKQEFDLDTLLNEILSSIENYIDKLEKGENLKVEYLENLFQYKTENRYKETGNNTFRGRIIGVNPEGKLIIKTKKGNVKSYNFKEIEFLL